MNNFYSLVNLRQLETVSLRWSELLQNPIWYVTVVTCLAGFTIYLRFWWWLTGAIALLWGLWLVWQFFSSKNQSPVDNETQLQNWLNRALDYRAKINQALKHTEPKNNPRAEQSLMVQIDGWINVVQELVQRLTLLRQDNLIYHELSTVPQIIEALELQLGQTSDATLRAQLQWVLTHRRTQLTRLQHLQTTIKQTEIQIESTLSLLSTIYAQILTGQTVIRVAASHRFLTDIDEEVNRLQDHLEALCEVKRWG